MNVEWTDKRGVRNILVAEPLAFHVDPPPDVHVYEPEERRYLNGPKGVVHLGPCVGCYPYRYPESHPIHAIGSAIGSADGYIPSSTHDNHTTADIGTGVLPLARHARLSVRARQRTVAVCRMVSLPVAS